MGYDTDMCYDVNDRGSVPSGSEKKTPCKGKAIEENRMLYEFPFMRNL